MKDLALIKETMSSIEIAELTGKLHKDVLEAIRIMVENSLAVAPLRSL